VAHGSRARSAARVNPASYTPCFRYRGSELVCEGVPLERIAARAGTPAYVYSRASLASAYRRFRRAFSFRGAPPHTICYAVKANSNLAILQLFARMGSWFDIVSGGELYRLMQAGISPARAVFSGVGKTREEIREALGARIRLFNVESEAELELLAEVASRARRPAPAAVRVNPDVGARTHPHIATGRQVHKFGVDWQDARRLYVAWRNSPWIDWQGISTHIGSQILSLDPFRRAVARLAGYVRELARAGIRLRYFDFGGGVGIRYSTEQPFRLEDYARVIGEELRPLGCRLLLEPGRVLAGPAGVLLTRVLYEKRAAGGRKRFVVVDAAMNDLIRPALYDAVHPITHARRSGTSRPATPADIVGPVCESGDAFLHDWPLEACQPGDLLVVWGTGAYGFVAASNYNSRPRPAEVLVEGNRFRVIRRRESRADLVRGE
jgi:diaminopimelate decarboxylase